MTYNSLILQRLLVYVWCGVATLLLAACNTPLSKITYQQVGACNANEVGAQDHLAFVFFRFQEIDNSKTSASYSFHPKRLWLNTDPLYSGYDYVATGQQASIFGLSPMLSAVNVAPGATIQVNKYVVFLVETPDPDAPNEANNTSYFLLYDNPQNEVGKLLVRSNSSQTSWPNTHRCADINFPRQSTCLTCHAVDTKMVGPSFREIAVKYKGKADAQERLVAQVAGAKGHPAVDSSATEVRALVKWILSM